MFDSLRLHGQQYTRLPCPSLYPGVCSDSCLLSRWCYLTILSSAAPFSYCLQSFPTSKSFQWVSSSHQVAEIFSFNISPSNEHSGLVSFRIDWFDLFVVQRTLKSLLQHHNSTLFGHTGLCKCWWGIWGETFHQHIAKLETSCLDGYQHAKPMSNYSFYSLFSKASRSIQ